MKVFESYYRSPLGFIRIRNTENELIETSFCENEIVIPAKKSDLTQQCIEQLDEYFAGKRISFDLPLAFSGTEFQKKIWSILEKIPFGITKSYLEIAIKAGDKNLTRAVGNANGANKIAIIIPCHRVIGSNGKLTGYAGGEWRKKWLLQFESGVQKFDFF